MLVSSKLKFPSFGSDSLTVTFFSSSSLGLLSCGKRTWRKLTKRLLIRLRIHWNMKTCFLNSKRPCRPKRYDSFQAINIVVLNSISLLRLSGQSAGYHSINVFLRNGRYYDVWSYLVSCQSNCITEERHRVDEVSSFVRGFCSCREN